MGAEGRIEIARITDGHHFIADELPTFKVTGPVAVFPIHCSTIGKCACTPTMTWESVFANSCGISLPVLCAVNVGPYILVVAPRTDFARARARTEEHERKYVGGKAMEYCLEHWDAIIPGWWAFVSYWDTGGGGWSCRWPKGIKFGEKLDWELWT